MDGLTGFVQSTLGPGAVIEDRSRAFGRRSRTWCVHPADGRPVFVKQHESRALFHAVGGIPWSIERGDRGFEATNRRIIARVLSRRERR